MSEPETPEQKKPRPRKYRRPPRRYQRKPKNTAEAAAPDQEGVEENKAAVSAETAAPPAAEGKLPVDTGTLEKLAPSEADKPKGIKSAITRLFSSFGAKEEEAPRPPIPATGNEQPAAIIEAEAEAKAKPAETAAPATEQPSGPEENKKEQPRPSQQKKRPPKRKATQGKPAPKKQETAAEKASPSPTLKLLINTEEPEECRIALIENGKVEAFHIETITREKTKGNIYKGKIVSVEPSLHAVFVDIGLEKNAFLPFNEIHPEYYTKEVDADIHWKDLEYQGDDRARARKSWSRWSRRRRAPRAPTSPPISRCRAVIWF